MSGWGGGYITDIPYSIGWYRQQSPVRIAIASIMGGSLTPIPRGDDPVMMLELGCGMGYTSMLLAASNPSWTVTAVDFNPTHIAIAREWAAEAGLTNITFIEGDFSKWEEDPALRDLPEMDFVTMHGIWSWVPPAAQKGIVRLLARKVRSGGLVHLSYNSTIGWVELLPAARLIREAGNRVAGRSDHQAQEGLRLVQDLLKAEAQVLHDKPVVASRLELFGRSSSDYLAHEFMNEYWAPCFSMDVAAALSEAKLEWVASGELADNFPELAMTDAQREIFRRYDDPLMQEMIRDMCAPRGLRHDVFIRGARRITPAQRNAALMDVNLSLTKNASELPESIGFAAGKADLNKEFYQPIVKALSERPRRVGDLLQLPEIVGRRDNPAELIAILTSAEMVEPTLRPSAEPGEMALRFNAVSAKRMFGTVPFGRVIAAACYPTGGPLTTTLLNLILMDFIRGGMTSAEDMVRALPIAPEKADEARTSIQDTLDKEFPILKAAGVY